MINDEEQAMGGMGGMGGGLGGMLGGLLGGGQGGKGGGMQGMIVKMALAALAGKAMSGGLDGLLGKLKQGGLGQQAQSWVDTGNNQPVSGQELTEALGHEEIDKFAAEAGVSREEAAAELAAVLPQLVNGVTPDGQVPPQEQLSTQLGGLLDKPAPQ